MIGTLFMLIWNPFRNIDSKSCLNVGRIDMWKQDYKP